MAEQITPTAAAYIRSLEPTDMAEYMRTLAGCIDRGSSDAYYGRSKKPHYFQGCTNGYNLSAKEITNLDEHQIAAYNYGYDNETDRKDWR